MKLELKHVASYLPYGLKIARASIDGDFKGIEYSLRETNLVEVLRYDNLKPILRPLSDLNNKEYNDITRILWNKCLLSKCFVSDRYLTEKLDLKSIDYFTMVLLIKSHFDIFGLIEKGFAIDINTTNLAF